MREFIDTMRNLGLVQDIDDPVSSEYEGPQLSAQTTDLLFFHNFGRNRNRAVMNVTTTRQALATALSVPVDTMVPRLSQIPYTGSVIDEGDLATHPADLDTIPIMKHYHSDAGLYLTSAIVFSRYGEVENASIHRMLQLGKDRLVARLVEGRHTHSLLTKALANNEELPVGITIGTHPLVTFACCSRVPGSMELPFAASLLGGEIGTRTLSNGVRVPDAEIVLEGYIGSGMEDEGPFVDITGTYDPVRRQPVIRLTGMFTRPDPIYHGILPGGDEHKILMGTPYEPLIYRSVGQVTGVTDVVLSRGGCGYLHAIIQIAKRTDGDGKNAIMAAFAAHTSLKHVVVVDTDINPSDPVDVEYAIATRVRADKDLMVIPGVRGSSLDPMRISDGMNVKMGIDATMECGRENECIRARWD
ncbi:MAG: UbiD family decarboxylase [Methanospirillaceae archaeon]|nr:UbiD family decarboxylase [Methanospirillaceae archaeon]